MANRLSKIQTEVPPQFPLIVMHAKEKFGKTSFGAFSHKPVFGLASGENGLLTLIDAKAVPPTPHLPMWKHWADVREDVRSLISDEHKYGTLVLDTGNGLETMCAQCVCDRDYQGSWIEYQNWGKQGDRLAAQEWSSFMDDLDRLRTHRKMMVIMLYHSKVKSVDNPTMLKSWDNFEPEGIKPIWSVTAKRADVILYGGMRIAMVKDKAVSEGRYLRATPHPAIIAGGRYALPDEIEQPKGTGAKGLWEAFASAMRKAKGIGEVCTAAQINALKGLIDQSGTPLESVLKLLGVDALEKAPVSKYKDATAMLMQGIEAKAKAEAETEGKS